MKVLTLPAVLLFCSSVALGAAAGPPPRSILLLMSGDAGDPTGERFVEGFRQSLPVVSDPQKPPFVVYAEHLDLNRFAGAPGYREHLRSSFVDKYAARHVDVIVTMYDEATDFAIDTRDKLWPGATIVAGGVRPGRFEGKNRPRNLTGWTLAYDTAGMVSVIRASIPGTRKLVFISGASPTDRAWLMFAQKLFQKEAPDLEQVPLSALPLSEMLGRLRKLPPDAVVLFLSYLMDGNGRPIELSSLAPLIARTANRPSFAPNDTALGTGVLATHGVLAAAMGRLSCDITQRVLDGERLVAQPLLPPPAPETEFDWRQMRRWDVEESDLPPDSTVLFREPSLWHDHAGLVSVTIAALVTLIAFVIGLFIERRRRINAQVESQQRLVEISAMDRRAALGELSASIAHEINQPLGAIMNNAEAARMMLARPDPPIEELRVAVSAIRDDDRRASEIVRRIRALVARSALEMKLLDVNEVVIGTLAIFGSDIRSRGIHLVTHLREVPPVPADATHLQQVVLNVLLNAIESMKDVGERVLFIRTFEKDGFVGITVTDSGRGFTPETLRRAFEPFFTTRSGDSGMGMGLAISRRIIEAHSGTILAENNPAGNGAVLTILLPCGEPEESQRNVPASPSNAATAQHSLLDEIGRNRSS